MEWLEAVVHTTTFGSDLVSDEMMALGAAGCEIVDRADVPDPRQPGVYWELYDPAMIDAMPDDVLVKAWFERGEKERETIEAVRAQLEQLRRISAMTPKRLVKSRQEYLDIIYALRTRDLVSATRHLSIHLQNIKESTLNVCMNMVSQY